MIDRLIYYQSNRGPTIVRKLSSVAGDFDVQPGMTFRLRVRERSGAALLLDEPMSPDVTADTLTYAPGPTDFATEGIFRAWVQVDFGGGTTQDSDEFEIHVLAHAPGEGTRTGTVWRAARELAPVAWDSLRGYKDYGDPGLQRQIELAKLRVFRSLVPVANEASFDVRVTDYLAKKVLVDGVLEAAINFWTNQVVSRTARANSDEVETYPDRIRAHENQLARLKSDLDAQRAELEEVLGTATGPVAQGPSLDSAGQRLITPGLEDFPWPDRGSGVVVGAEVAEVWVAR